MLWSRDIIYIYIYILYIYIIYIYIYYIYIYIYIYIIFAISCINKYYFVKRFKIISLLYYITKKQYPADYSKDGNVINNYDVTEAYLALK